MSFNGKEGVFINRTRKSRYRRLREIRRERDYQSGSLQYTNRPYSFRVVVAVNGKVKSAHVTTKQFINNYVEGGCK